MKGYLVLEDGTVFQGMPFGFAKDVVGEVVFSTFPQMASLRPNVFPAVENAKAGAVVKFDPALDAGQLKTRVEAFIERIRR